MDWARRTGGAGSHELFPACLPRSTSYYMAADLDDSRPVPQGAATTRIRRAILRRSSNAAATPNTRIPRADGRWSGRSTLVPSGWTIGGGANDRRVCRYTADLDSNGSVDGNEEHPAEYLNVDRPLANQNFLVVKGSEACPAAATAQHQP